MENFKNTDTTGQIAVYLDPELALTNLVIAPIADRFGVAGEEVEAAYDTALLFSAVTEYDSINGREGFRLRSDLAPGAFWDMVELYQTEALS